MESAEYTNKLLGFFKVLADANRLKIIGLLAVRSYTVEDLAKALNLTPSTTSHHLSRLADLGLVTAQAKGYYSIYSLQTEMLETMSRNLLARENLPNLIASQAGDPYAKKVINEFTSEDESIKAFPAQRKKMDILLAYVARSFELDKKYSEKLVNEILKQYNEDFATLRRELIDIKYMGRKSGEYWLTELGYNSSRSYR